MNKKILFAVSFLCLGFTACKSTTVDPVEKEREKNPIFKLFKENKIDEVKSRFEFADDINDKNSFSAIIFMLEILCYLKSKNMTLGDYLEEIYSKFGYYSHVTKSITFDNLKDREKLMDKLRKTKVFEGEMIDYEESRELKSNALKFILNDNEYFMIRPSGTEPKLKIYFIVNDTDLNKSNTRLNLLIDKVMKELK